MARCIDDHPAAICLCESEINRALFRNYFLYLHGTRMIAHGLTTQEVIAYLDRKRPEDIDCLLAWYRELTPRLMELYGKSEIACLGDKSPDFFESPELVSHLAANYPLIYTVRDPRAILASIEAQKEEPVEDRRDRWTRLMLNYLAWKPYLEQSNFRVVRYEDLVASPETIMRQVYSHLGLAYSARFFEPFPRAFASRFLWSTTIDLENGGVREFDPSRVSQWRKKLSYDQAMHIYEDNAIVEFMQRFGYRQ